MPFLHRWVGNPFFSFLVRKWFHAPINDVYCGLRGFTRAMYERLDQRCTGMEFATEMIIKASLHGEKITEIPITLHPDRRTSHAFQAVVSGTLWSDARAIERARRGELLQEVAALRAYFPLAG
jgi:hypothetical protein